MHGENLKSRDTVWILASCQSDTCPSVCHLSP